MTIRQGSTIIAGIPQEPGNGTITITQGGITKGTFTVNQSVNTTVALDAGGSDLPSQSGNNGKYLTTNGSTLSWAVVDALPSQTSQNGKFLSTNGTVASWVAIEEYTAAEVQTLWNSITPTA